MISPFSLPPSPEAQQAASELINKVHAYMRAHPDSELHHCGKMFGVLVGRGGQPSAVSIQHSAVSHQNSEGSIQYIAAFSAKLDGSYYHEGFVPPVYDMQEEPVGTSKEESRRLQRLLFANYSFTNGEGVSKNLLEIFQNEKPIIPAEEWFGKSAVNHQPSEDRLPPSGAGECCAPKLLQYALKHGMEPLSMAEFWIGAPSKTEIRHEGTFYPPCSGKCVPILRHMMKGIEEVTSEQINELRNERRPEVVYEDEWLMVVNKPAGMLSVPGKSEEPSVEDYFKFQNSNFKFLKAVHRLDQDTSGLLVLAKTAEVYKELQSYFQRRDILKRYEAVVRSEGVKELRSEGTISLPLLPNPYDRPRQMVNKEHGKVAITRYILRELRPDGTTLVDFYPLTGRTHQLRVHAAHPEGLNAPIVGDRLYGMIASLNDANDANGERRLMLHAAEIRFVHPVTKEEMHFCIPSHF